MRGNRGLVVLLAVIAIAVAVLFFNGDGRIAGLDDGQFAGLAYRGVWGVVLGSALLVVFRGNLSSAAKHLGIYALAFLLLIGLYAYRGEFREIGDRILSELIPGHAITVAGSSGEKVQVMRAEDAHFHVDAVVNGRSISFLVDTGASVVALDRDAAEAIGLDPSTLDFSSRVMTANGLARSAPVRLSYVRIGGIERENVAAAVMDSSGDGISLLGMSFLGTLSAVEFRGDSLVLTD